MLALQALKDMFQIDEIRELDQLLYAEVVGDGPWKLYIYRPDGFHEGGQWFRRGGIKYPNEEISFDRAKQYADTAVGKKLEVRICDGMDWLVFHSVKGKTLHGSTFWNEAVGKNSSQAMGKCKRST